jgi:hypothetical protein
MIDPVNVDILHHMLNYECDPSAVFDDSNLPHGICDELADDIAPCASNIATGWAVGGDYVSFRSSETNYFITTIHCLQIDF